MSKARECICCNQKYRYCPNCDHTEPAWKAEFCSESCKDLWLTATKFNMKFIEKSDAKNIINALNLKDKTEYVPCIQRDLDNIFAEDEVSEANDVEIEISVTDESESVEETHEVVKTRKRNKAR